MTADEAARFARDFADALNRRDREAWIAAFDEDFEGYSGLVEVEGGAPFRGSEGAGAWFDNLLETYETVQGRVEQSVVIGDHALHLVLASQLPGWGKN